MAKIILYPSHKTLNIYLLSFRMVFLGFLSLKSQFMPSILLPERDHAQISSVGEGRFTQIPTEWAGVKNSRKYNLSSLKSNHITGTIKLRVVGVRELGQTNKKVESSRWRWHLALPERASFVAFLLFPSVCLLFPGGLH